MIFNNFRAMRKIGTFKDEPLTQELVFELHRCVTEDTLDDGGAGGRFRTNAEDIVVSDQDGTVFHRPPQADELPSRLQSLCHFANQETPNYFVHPVLRAIILHFWVGYDHPFVDGNGRTARALFYWAMLKYGYWLWAFVSISRILLQAPSQYARAFLYSETDDNDLTHFITYQIDVMRRAMDDLHQFIDRKVAQLREIERTLRGSEHFNQRQRALISHALRHPHHRYTFVSHKTSHNVVYQTARTDLLGLQQRGLLESFKIGKTWYFSPARDLETRLRALGE
jgi:Fic family protein